MRERPWRTTTLFVILVVPAALGLSGCDYWPPSLQAQIEQLRVETQAAAAERASLETQLAETTKLKDELQARADQLTRQNQELVARVAGLEKTVAEREKAVKAAAKPVKKPTAAKTSRKTTTKTRSR